MKKLVLTLMLVVMPMLAIGQTLHGPDSADATATTAGVKVKVSDDPTQITKNRLVYLSSDDGDFKYSVHRYYGEARGWENVYFGVAFTPADSVHTVAQDYIVPVSGKFDVIIVSTDTGTATVHFDAYDVNP